jgi:uncharacterized protein YkwD
MLAGPLAANDAQPAADAQAQRQIQRLVLDFTKARRNEARRVALIQKAAEMGSPAPERLLATLEKELAPQIRAYGERVSKLATTFEQKRARTIDADEVQRLRTSVLDLKKDPNLTKDAIIASGDPAMKRLSEILLPNMQAFADSSAALGKQRTALLAAGRMWELCATVVARQTTTEDGKPQEPPVFESCLRAEEESALQIATAADPQTRKALSVNAQLMGKLDPEEARCIAACNLTRGLLGLKLLEIDPRLCETARDHSNDMRTKGFFAHESPVEGKKTPWDRAKRFGATASGENIAVGVQQGNAANLMWFHSPGHFRNMLGEHVRIGVGRSNAHWTEMFGA